MLAAIANPNQNENQKSTGANFFPTQNAAKFSPNLSMKT
jgi:hypothetical protein